MAIYIAFFMKNYIKKLLVIIPFAISVAAMPVHGFASLYGQKYDAGLLAEHQMSLLNRYPTEPVNTVFKDNILLTLFYMAGEVSGPADIDWNKIRQPFIFELKLNPGEVFAYHDDVLPEFQGKVVATTNAHFGASEGFISSGYLYGDGVCHLASLMNWAARDAGLGVTAPVYHDFARIPEISREYGTSIITRPYDNADQMQNLYIENTHDVPVRMVFVSDGTSVKVSFYKESPSN